MVYHLAQHCFLTQGRTISCHECVASRCFKEVITVENRSTSPPRQYCGHSDVLGKRAKFFLLMFLLLVFAFLFLDFFILAGIYSEQGLGYDGPGTQARFLFCFAYSEIPSGTFLPQIRCFYKSWDLKIILSI